MTYSLGVGSKRELRGVHDRLVGVVHRAIEITKQDFTVHDGLRTFAEQTEYVRREVSKTMKSKHLPQWDGFGHAVDLVPYIGRRLRWEWPPIFVICKAMRTAAEELDVPIRWGGCWLTLNGTTLEPKVLMAEYVDRKRRKGKDAFPDGPHYELML